VHPLSRQRRLKLKIWIGALAGLAAGGVIAVTALSQAQAFDINGIQSGMPKSTFLKLMKMRNITVDELTSKFSSKPVLYQLNRGCPPVCDNSDLNEAVNFCEGFLNYYMYVTKNTYDDFIKSIVEADAVRIRRGLPKIQMTVNQPPAVGLVADWHDGNTEMRLIYLPYGSIMRSYTEPSACSQK
jgi:hypothetical protein